MNPATLGLADVYSLEKAHRKSPKSEKDTFLKIKVYNVFNVRMIQTLTEKQSP